MKKADPDLISALLGPSAVLLPIPSGEKGPKFKGWQKLTFQDTQARGFKARLRSHGNLGVLLGAASGGLCSIDIDRDEEVEPFLKLNPDLRASLRTKGERGENIWIRIDGGFPKLTKITRNGSPWGEWRADGGQTVIAGKHPSGGRYHFVNKAQPLVVRFEDIRWPIEASFPPGGSGEEGPSSECSELLHQSASSTASASSTLLHDTSETTSPKSKALDAVKAQKEFEEKEAYLAGFYDKRIEQIHTPLQGRRNTSLIEIVTFSFYCLGTEQVLKVAEQFYDRNAPTWKDPKDQHMKEAEHHLRTLVKEFPDQLPPDEREIYVEFDDREKATFRICRDLARINPEIEGEGAFFLACNELGGRLGLDPQQAQRLLRRLTGLAILEVVEKGQRRQAGVKSKATTYRWCWSLES